MRLRPWRPPALRPEPLGGSAVVGDLVRSSVARDGECLWRGRGGSMAGAIRHDDVVRLVPPESLRTGDVVMAALPDGRLVLHRVERLDGDTVRLRGDARRRSDPPVERTEVIAKVDPCPSPSWRARAYRLVSA